MKTAQEITELKKSWELDPCWDIENTEGFEDHKQELIEFREKKESEWEEKSIKEKQQIMKRLYSLELGYSVDIRDNRYTRVPGGWIWQDMETDYNGDRKNTQMLFIPYNEEFKIKN